MAEISSSELVDRAIVLLGVNECGFGPVRRLACTPARFVMPGSRLRVVVLGVASFWCATGVLAQGAPVPNVNDCTFIRDPTALRDCIELYEGQRLAPGPRPAAFQQPPVIDQSLLDAAGPIPATGVSRRGKRRKLRQSRRPATPAQAVQVEQLAPPQ
jgi:hypothetical protein